MGTPAISAVMTVRNRDDYLEKAIRSISNQTFSDFELLIVNDGSTSEKVSKIIMYAAKSDNRIRVITQENKGAAEARNTGIRESSAPLVAIMDDDDISVDIRFQVQYNYLSRHPELAGVATGLIFIDGRDRKLRRGRAFNTLIESPFKPSYRESLEIVDRIIMNATSMFRKEALEHIGGYRGWFRHVEDIDLTLRLMEHGQIVTIPDQLYMQRIHSDRSRVSQAVSHWDFYSAAVMSSYCRCEGIEDPVELGIDHEEIHQHLRSLPGFARQHLIWKSRSSLRKFIRDGDKNRYAGLRDKCLAIAVDEDTPIINRLKKRTTWWAIRYLSLWATQGWPVD